MKISVISVGQNMSNWARQEFTKYQERLNQVIQLQLIEIPMINAKKRNSSIIKKESQDMLNACKNDSVSIALSPVGKNLNSDEFAAALNKWQSNNFSVSFLIGGPEGLSDEIIKRANSVWSLSQLTFPHMLVRIILAEQIYRGYCKNINHPYYK